MPARRAFSLLLATLVLQACATTTGPQVTLTERARAAAQLAEKSRRYQLGQLSRIWDVGYRVIKTLPTQDRHESRPWLGFLTFDQLPAGLRPANLHDTPVVALSLSQGPAAAAGIGEGTRIEALNGRRVPNGNTLAERLSSADEGNGLTAVQLHVRTPAGEVDSLDIVPETLGLPASFYVTTENDVNAATDGRRVVVSGGMMRFLGSDDELAVVLGHELAHITRGHIPKAVAQRTGLALAGAVLGAIIAPGTNLASDLADLSVSTFAGRFNQDLEREADVYGLWYAHLAGYDVAAGALVWERFAVEMPASMTESFFHTHPASPERMLRAQKIASLIAGGGTLADLLDGGAGPSQPAVASEAARPTAPGSVVSAGEVKVDTSPSSEHSTPVADSVSVRDVPRDSLRVLAPAEADSLAATGAGGPSVIRQARVKVVPAGEVRVGPGTRYDIVYRPPHGTVLVIEGDWGDWFRVRLPEMSTGPSEGFIHRTAVEVTVILAPGGESDGEAGEPAI